MLEVAAEPEKNEPTAPRLQAQVGWGRGQPGQGRVRAAFGSRIHDSQGRARQGVKASEPQRQPPNRASQPLVGRLGCAGWGWPAWVLMLTAG